MKLSEKIDIFGKKNHNHKIEIDIFEIKIHNLRIEIYTFTNHFFLINQY